MLNLTEAVTDEIMENITEGENLEIIRNALEYFFYENYPQLTSGYKLKGGKRGLQSTSNR